MRGGLEIIKSTVLHGLLRKAIDKERWNSLPKWLAPLMYPMQQ